MPAEVALDLAALARDREDVENEEEHTELRREGEEVGGRRARSERSMTFYKVRREECGTSGRCKRNGRSRTELGQRVGLWSQSQHHQNEHDPGFIHEDAR